MEECAVIARRAVVLAQPSPCTSSSYPSELGRVASPGSCSSKSSSPDRCEPRLPTPSLPVRLSPASDYAPVDLMKIESPHATNTD